MHDFSRVQRDLQESLSLDKHPVAILIGAGCPSAVRISDPSGASHPLIPDVRGLTEKIDACLTGDPSYANLKKQFLDDGVNDFTIEDALSRVRLLARVAGRGNVRGLSENDLTELEKKLCEQISRVVKIELPNEQTAYHHLADWLGAIDRSRSPEIFTTNYDLLLEQALEDRRIPFFDGFIGCRRPFFDLRAIEDETLPPRWVRLWKLHGSINWRYVENGLICRSYPISADADGVLIHPSELKYDQSRRMPYLAMLDRLSHFLKYSSAFLVTIGYSFSDQHLNEVLVHGMRSNPTAACFGLLYRILSEEKAAYELSKNIPTNVNLVARDAGIIRGIAGAWQPDANAAPGTAATTSELGDFAAFASFARGLSPRGDA